MVVPVQYETNINVDRQFEIFFNFITLVNIDEQSFESFPEGMKLKLDKGHLEEMQNPSGLW